MKMEIFEDAWLRGDLPRGGVVTIGNFDGVHLGQRGLLDRTRQRAAEIGRPSVAVTFEPHPLRILQPDRAPLRLTTRQQKHELLAESGVDALVEILFTPAFGRTSATEFVDAFLVQRMGVCEVYVGSRFSFGRNREGTLELLVTRGAASGFSAEGVAEVPHTGEPISSTRIRRAVSEGRVEEAREMLGRAYGVAGVVTGGEGRGRGLGWPTANLEVENELYPGNGVYATEVRLAGDPVGRPSVTNVGTRPTFEGGRRQIESHLLDFADDLYGHRMELGFCRRLRGERRFESPAELVSQIELDVARVREYFATCVC